MITLEWIEETKKNIIDARQKSIFKVLANSYEYWYKESKQNSSWPYDEHVKDMLWDCEVALLAFTRS